MTRFWWVRHGPTHAKSFAGWRDIPADLSDHAAIARLNAHLPKDALVISSDLSRAVTTADCLKRSRLPHDPRLREFNFGDWDGLAFADVMERWPDLSRRYWEEPGHVAPPGGESWIAAETRIDQAVADLISGHPGREIVVVAHHGTILTQYAQAAGVSPYQALAQPIRNLSVTCLELGAEWVVHSVDHLA